MSGTTPVIEVGGLTLRPPAHEDISWVFDACQDPEISRWTEVPWPYKAHHAVAFVTDRSDELWRYVITATETGELYGAIALKWFDSESGRGEIGYWLEAEARGKGVLSRALAGLEAEAADRLGARELVLRIAVGNERSIAVAHRNGYVETSREPAACKGLDAVVFTKQVGRGS